MFWPWRAHAHTQTHVWTHMHIWASLCVAHARKSGTSVSGCHRNLTNWGGIALIVKWLTMSANRSRFVCALKTEWKTKKPINLCVILQIKVGFIYLFHFCHPNVLWKSWKSGEQLSKVGQRVSRYKVQHWQRLLEHTRCPGGAFTVFVANGTPKRRRIFY